MSADLPDLDLLRAAGVLSPLDVAFARSMARLGGEANPVVVLAAALASHQVAGGHVCLDLHAIDEIVLDPDPDEPARRIEWAPPPAEAFLRALGPSPLVGEAAPGSSPLVLDRTGRLYLRRYWEHEGRVAEALLARASAAPDAPGRDALEAGLDRLFGEPTAEPDRQRAAAATALERRLAVISGGPGTGKTSTVVKILALLFEHRPSLRVHLMAPTGKAAARLTESIQRAKRDLPVEQAIRVRIPEHATTIHRALGTVRGKSTRFRHDRDRPLTSDLVLVDEASMVDLALMRRLLDALPEPARLILLGDENQLASVEAGAVLGDVCGAGADTAEEDRLALFRGGATGAPSPPLAPSIVRLTRSWRYDPTSGIGALARAVNAGDAEAAVRVLEDEALADVALAPPPPADALGHALSDEVVRGYGAYLAATGAAERLRCFGRFRVLSAHRRGPWGVETLSARIEQALRDRGLLSPARGAHYPGQPLLVTRNDYEAGLFNGDVGMIEDEGEGLRAFFVAPDGTWRALAPARLPAHETVFAMTVHKSQGSELDEVAVVLPPEPSPVVTRELLYTAVTRARRRVTVHATPDVIAAAVRTRVRRASGLRDRLWRDAAPEGG